MRTRVERVSHWVMDKKSTSFRKIHGVLLVGGLLLAGSFLYLLKNVHPTEWAYLVRCDLHAFTGLECPGCGGTRAAHYLLNGDLNAAWHHNGLFIALLPVCGMLLTVDLFYRWKGRPIRWSVERMLWTLLGLIVVFMIIRNIPWEPFTALDPDHFREDINP